MEMGRVVKPIAIAGEGVFNYGRRRPKPGHGSSGAFVKVMHAIPTPVVRHDSVILQTTSSILDDRFALAVGTTHRQMALYPYILSIIL
jgi:hypothetical protein